ncbi:MAG: fibronectin type III domain-containing protein [Bacteroidia bacterium]
MVVIIVPSLKLRKKGDSDLRDYAEKRIAKVPLVFPATNPTVADLQKVSDDYHAAILKAVQGTPGDTAAKQALRKIISVMLTELARDCAYQSNGDVAKYLDTGFEMKVNGPGPVVTAVANLRLLIVNDSELEVRFDKVNGAKAYLIYLGEDPADADSFKLAGTSSDTSFTLENLTSGKKYYSRVRAIGTRKAMGPWSSVIGKICA